MKPAYPDSYQKMMAAAALTGGCCVLSLAVIGVLIAVCAGFGSGWFIAVFCAVLSVIFFLIFLKWKISIKKGKALKSGTLSARGRKKKYLYFRKGEIILLYGVILVAVVLMMAAFVSVDLGYENVVVLGQTAGLIGVFAAWIILLSARKVTLQELNEGEQRSVPPDSDAGNYRVTVTLPERAVRGEPFFVRVESENISGRTLESATCSTLYKRGTAIEVYTVTPAGEALYLQDEFLAVTLDYRVQEVLPGEVLAHDWKFDGTLTAESAEKNGGDGMAPAGKCFVRDYAGLIYSFELK